MNTNIGGFNTIDEMTNYWYNADNSQIRKEGFNTETDGVYNPLYGAQAWINFNLEANVFAALPKYVWDFSGWRMIADRAPDLADKGLPTGNTQDANRNNSPLGGVVEGGLIADSVRPTIKEISVKPKTLQQVFETSDVQEGLVNNSRDDNYGSLYQQTIYFIEHFKEKVNLQLTKRAADADVAANTTGENIYSQFDLETLDRMISSKAEHDANPPTNQTDVYNPWRYTSSNTIDRSTTDTYDSTVIAPSGKLNYAEDSDILTNSTLTHLMAQVRTEGGTEGTVFIGGQDTYREIQALYQGAYRIQNTADTRTEFSATVNGVKSFTGTGVGLHISTVYGIPFIPSKDTTRTSGKDTDVGDLYLLNTAADNIAPGKPLIGIQVQQPFSYYEASRRQPGSFFLNGAFTNRGMYYGKMESTCRNFKRQGKIINIAPGI